ncbi:MAG: hypothetical protein IPN94_26530 [Sphingobacteriales bacterium]|nr:hypothetical protein [Sphingobacteriales bacterium]
MPNATTLHQGDTLKLSIGFLCNNPSFVVAVDDKKIFGGMDGLARITRPCDKVGEHIMKGTITHLTGFGEKNNLPLYPTLHRSKTLPITQTTSNNNKKGAAENPVAPFCLTI